MDTFNLEPIQPETEEAYHFGDINGQSIFVPIEPEYDANGNQIISEVIGYDKDGKEIWN